MNIFTRKWAQAAGIRTLKTVAQAAVASIGTTTALGGVDWKPARHTDAFMIVTSAGMIARIQIQTDGKVYFTPFSAINANTLIEAIISYVLA